MKIKQIETTPIGNYFHDNGMKPVFSRIESVVDDFEVDTDELNDWIDDLISNLKGLKNQIKACEAAYVKYVHMQEIEEAKHRG